MHGYGEMKGSLRWHYITPPVFGFRWYGGVSNSELTSIALQVQPDSFHVHLAQESPHFAKMVVVTHRPTAAIVSQEWQHAGPLPQRCALTMPMVY
jgi:hypothetical protein